MEIKYLDPKRQRAYTIRLIVGYILVGIAIVLATLILLYQAYGFGLGKNGQVVQNGFVFVSSQPGGADIYVNGKLNQNTTNTRLQLPEGTYHLAIKKTGYRPWQRIIPVAGGNVYRYDYPILIPQSLQTTSIATYQAAPAFATQSPDRRWVLVQRSESLLNFDVYDLSNFRQVTTNETQISLPASVLSSTSGTWKLTDWSNDNRHVVLQHDYSGGSEYVLVDRTDPAKTVNLTKTLGLKTGDILSLIDNKFDRYYIFNAGAKTVDAASLDSGTTWTPELTDVLEFKPYGDSMFLYATDKDAPAGKVETMLKDGEATYEIRQVAAGAPYLLNLAQYDGDWFMAVGSRAENAVYVFKDPEAVRQADSLKNLVPTQVLHIAAPNYLQFSANTRFIMTENGTNFSVFDAEYNKNYTYAAVEPLDPAEPHATWMDGDRIMYVSGNKVFFFDYDNINPQLIVSASPTYLPFFDRDYRNLYTLTPPVAANGQAAFTQTPLLTPKDQ